MLDQNETIRNFQHRFPILFLTIAVVFGLLSLRLFQLQILRGEDYRLFSQNNSLRQEKIPGARGQIFDRNGQILVANRLQLDIVATPQFVKNPKEVMATLAELSGQDPERLLAAYEKGRRTVPQFHPVTVIRNAPWPVVAKIESLKEGLPGVAIQTAIRRTYLDGEIGAQVFGYIGEVNDKEIERMAQKGFTYKPGDFIGKDGIEKQWERYLRGRDGIRHVVVNAHGRRAAVVDGSHSLLSLESRNRPSQPGSDLVLTLDQELQYAAAEAMEGMMGATVALNVKTGEILAMISNPSFDHTDLAFRRSEIWQGLIHNPWGPLRNKAIQDHFSPGSTFKAVTALAALNNGIVSKNTILNCPPTLRFGRRTYHDHNRGGFGKINLKTAIQKSSNVFFWQLAMRLDIDQIAETARALGLGRLTGVDLPSEIPGLIPTHAWKERERNEPWYPGETLSVAIGQGATLVTPLQLASAYATIANGGVLYQPFIVSKVLDREGGVVKSFEPKMMGKATEIVDNMEAIKEGLYAVVNEPGGTAYWRGRLEYPKIAGKSGTTQVASRTTAELFKSCHEMPFEERHHAWFVGFAPYEDPEIVVATFGLHQCGGSSAASPVVKAVVEKWYEIKTRNQPQPKLPASI